MTGLKDNKKEILELLLDPEQHWLTRASASERIKELEANENDLRDTFAVAALSAFLTASPGIGRWSASEMSYKYANAMLEERKKYLA